MVLFFIALIVPPCLGMKLQLKFILLIFKLSAAEKSGTAPDSSITIFCCV